jgi:transcriptional/translational regulatory protein YebC/TACO1
LQEEQHFMAGHSKWANIQHRKGRQDEKRGKVWTRIIREIIVAARQGGADLAHEPAVAAGHRQGQGGQHACRHRQEEHRQGHRQPRRRHYEEIRYEGYGIGGAAVIVDTMTDNRVRTVAEVRHAFSKYGGNLGTEGSVAFQFKHCGQLLCPWYQRRQGDGGGARGRCRRRADRRRWLDRGAEPRRRNSKPSRTALEAAGLKPEMAEVTMRAENTVEIGGEDAIRMQKLLDVIEDLDDVQDVFHNAELSE